MPSITERLDYNGFAAKTVRLGLDGLVAEAESALSGFELLVKEEKHANGTQGLRKEIDRQFDYLGGWTKIAVGGIDWTKKNDTGSSIGVEVQVSGRSDLLAVDVIHLREELIGGRLDVGIIFVPDDLLSRFLTDRTPNLRTALRHVESRAKDMAVCVVAFRHDGMNRPGFSGDCFS